MFDAEAYRRQVRAFIAEHSVPMACEGIRVPRDDGEERAIRNWLRALYDAGHLGAGWPAAWGGNPRHQAIQDLILMEELILGDAYRPLDQVMLAAHTIVEFGSDEQKRTLLPKIPCGHVQGWRAAMYDAPERSVIGIRSVLPQTHVFVQRLDGTTPEHFDRNWFIHGGHGDGREAETDASREERRREEETKPGQRYIQNRILEPITPTAWVVHGHTGS